MTEQYPSAAISPELSELHAQTYDALAASYEERVETWRPVTEYALNYLTRELSPGDRVLDIGCGVGYTVEIMRQAGVIVDGIDVSSAMVEYARQRNPHSDINQGDFADWPYAPESYDGIVLSAFIHLFPHDQAVKMMEKATSLLKPGGMMFVGTTKSSESTEGFEEKADYGSTVARFRKRWTQSELEAMLEILGLQAVHTEIIYDEFDKCWMDYIVKKSEL